MVVRYHRRLQRICLSKVEFVIFFTQKLAFSPNSCTGLTFLGKKTIRLLEFVIISIKKVINCLLVSNKSVIFACEFKNIT